MRRNKSAGKTEGGGGGEMGKSEETMVEVHVQAENINIHTLSTTYEDHMTHIALVGIM